MKRLLTLVFAAFALHANAQLVTVSSRVNQLAGSDVNVTFIIPEGAAQQVLIRHIGPTLGLFGSGNAMADPALELWRGGSLIASNDNWSDGSNAAALAQAALSVGAFSLSSGSKDSALYVTLAPGEYSLRGYSTTGTGGLVLAELYTANLGGSLQSYALETQVGVSPILSGFVQRGGSYLARAVGPGLGVGGAQDPSLSIQTQASIVTNGNWQNSSNATANQQLATRLNLLTLADGSADAQEALLNISAGIHTAIIQNIGASGNLQFGLYDLAYAQPPAAVPEPSAYSSVALLGIGLLTALRLRRKTEAGQK